jgi:hypothetical protein
LLAWAYEKMNVFGHDHVAPQGKVEGLASSGKGFDEPAYCLLGEEEGSSAVAGERQFMSVAGQVQALASLSERRFVHT